MINDSMGSVFYQKDEVFEMGDIVGDSLELAKKAKAASTKNIIFCSY